MRYKPVFLGASAVPGTWSRSLSGLARSWSSCTCTSGTSMWLESTITSTPQSFHFTYSGIPYYSVVYSNYYCKTCNFCVCIILRFSQVKLRNFKCTNSATTCHEYSVLAKTICDWPISEPVEAMFHLCSCRQWCLHVFRREQSYCRLFGCLINCN